MRKPWPNRRAGKVALVCLCVSLLAACGQTANWIKGRPTNSSGQTLAGGDAGVGNLIDELGQIASGDPAAQAEIYADAAAAAQLTADVSSQLRLGLVLAIPGHPESNPRQAQSILREVLAQTVLLTPAEISLARIHLNNVEQQIIADSEASRQQLSSSRAAESQQQRLRQQLDALQQENRQLQVDLDEAEQKLEAITSIERSIREQE